MKRPKVINFSGGKSSGLATIITYEPGDIVIFCDTKVEHPKTYKFINDFEANEGIPITRITYTHERAPGLEGFFALMFWKSIVPSRQKRICTAELKVNTLKRYIRPVLGMKFDQVIGLRADEMHRIDDFKPTYARSTVQFPLLDHGLTKADVNNFWAAKPYNLEIEPILGNCDLCFLKGKAAIITILQHYPELAEPWIQFEKWVKSNKVSAGLKNIKAQFFPDFSYEQLLQIATNQKRLFSLEDALPAYNCSCTA